MTILRPLLLLTNLHLKLLSTQGTGADKLLSTQRVNKACNKDKIEKVQRRAARFVSNNFRRKASVSEMLHNLGWQSLDSRRQDQRLALFYKIINGLASIETEDILTPADSRTRKNHSFKFKHLQANCDSYRYSFFPATISSWNNLPFGIEKVDSVEGFKLKLKEHTFRSP